MDSQIYLLAKRISKAGKIIAKDSYNKDFYIGGYKERDNIIVTSDSGYEAIYIGTIANVPNSRGYMCLYTNNTPQRNSFPSVDEIALLLESVINKEKLIEGEGKAAYFIWEQFGNMDNQLEYFAEVVYGMVNSK